MSQLEETVSRVIFVWEQERQGAKSQFVQIAVVSESHLKCSACVCCNIHDLTMTPSVPLFTKAFNFKKGSYQPPTAIYKLMRWQFKCRTMERPPAQPTSRRNLGQSRETKFVPSAIYVNQRFNKRAIVFLINENGEVAWDFTMKIKYRVIYTLTTMSFFVFNELLRF